MPKALERVAPLCTLAMSDTAAGKYSASVSPMAARQNTKDAKEPLRPDPTVATLERARLATIIRLRDQRSASIPPKGMLMAYIQPNALPAKPSCASVNPSWLRKAGKIEKMIWRSI